MTFTIITDRAAGRVDAGSERGFGDDAPAPDSVEQIVPADDAAAIADQVFK